MVGFHQESNTLDITLRPMTGSELSTDFAGCSWLESRLHVVRGTRRTYGPCEVKVNGEQTLEETPIPSPEDLSRGGDGAVHGDVPRLVAPWRRGSQKRGARPSFNDSGVSLDRRVSPTSGGAPDNVSVISDRSIRRCVQGLAAEVAEGLGTPTRPRVPRAPSMNLARTEAMNMQSENASTSSSIGGKLCFMILFSS